jgi:hypothetical protein
MANESERQIARDIMVAFLQSREGAMPSPENMEKYGEALGKMYQKLVTAVEKAYKP